MKIGPIDLSPPFALAPMAGMTDTAFRRLVKRRGGCGLVVTEMVSSEGLVRGIDRTLEYAEYTEEERPVSIQIFGGDPDKMAAAAQIVEGMGADIVDVNMGCPVPKIARHNAGCSLMREPAHAADVVRAMARAVSIPVTVKMRAGWDADAINAPGPGARMEDAGAAAVAVHGRTAAQSYTGVSDWELIGRVVERACRFPSSAAATASRPVSSSIGFGHLESAACWSAEALCATRGSSSRRPRSRMAARVREITAHERGRFLLDYLDLLLVERLGEAEGFRHVAPGVSAAAGPARGHDRWVINKLRALNSWYTKGLDNGSHLRVAINAAESIRQLREIIEDFFFEDRPAESVTSGEGQPPMRSAAPPASTIS